MEMTDNGGLVGSAMDLFEGRAEGKELNTSQAARKSTTRTPDWLAERKDPPRCICKSNPKLLRLRFDQAAETAPGAATAQRIWLLLRVIVDSNKSESSGATPTNGDWMALGLVIGTWRLGCGVWMSLRMSVEWRGFRTARRGIGHCDHAAMQKEGGNTVLILICVSH